MGVLASTTAGVASYYTPPSVIREFKQWIKKNNYPLLGFMMWDSNWDKLNGFIISDACVEPV
jgi:chitinase